MRNTVTNSLLGFCFFPFLEDVGLINVISPLVVHCLSLFSTLVCISTADKIMSCGYILIVYVYALADNTHTACGSLFNGTGISFFHCIRDQDPNMLHATEYYDGVSTEAERK